MSYRRAAALGFAIGLALTLFRIVTDPGWRAILRDEADRVARIPA